MHIPNDGIYLPDINKFIDAGGVTLSNLHSTTLCEGKACVIHNQSDHSMRSFPLHVRIPGPWDIKPPHFERICPHGIGHPDPDDMRYWIDVGESSMGVHGCDGCCREFHTLRITHLRAEGEYEAEVEYELLHPANCRTEIWEDPGGFSYAYHTCGESYEIEGAGLDSLAWDIDIPGYDESVLQSINYGMDAWKGLPAGDYEIKAWHTGPDHFGEYDGGLTLIRPLAVPVDPA